MDFSTPAEAGDLMEPAPSEESRSLPFPLSVLRAIFHPRDEWLLFFLGLFIFFIGANTQTGWLYVVEACIVSLLIIGWVAPRITVRRLRAYRDCPPVAYEGDTVTVRIRIVNPDRRHRYLTSVLDLPVAASPAERKTRKFFIPHLPPLSTVTVEFPMRCGKRGLYAFGPIRLQCATPVGFFPATRSLPSASCPEIVVYPRGPALRRLDVRNVSPRLSTNHHTFNRAGHSYDFSAIREYQPGDDTRYVHWFTTARTGRMMVKEFRELGAHSVTVLVDNADGPWAAGIDADENTPLDHAVRLASSLVALAHARSAGIVLLSARGQEVDLRANIRGVMALDWLARLSLEGGLSWGELLARSLDSLPRRGRLYVLTSDPRVDEQALRLMADRRIEASIYLVAPAGANFAPDLGEQGARVCGVDPYEEALETYRQRGLSTTLHRPDGALGATLATKEAVG